MNIIGKRYWGFLISFLIILPGIISLGLFRFNLGIEFTSGSTMTLVFEQSVGEDNLRQWLSDHGHGEAVIQGTRKSGFVVQTQALTQEQIENARNVLEAKFGSRNVFLSTVQGTDSTTLIAVFANPVGQAEFQSTLDGLGYTISSVSPTEKEAFLVRVRTLSQEPRTINTPSPPGNLDKTTPDNDNTPAFAWDTVADAASYEVKVDAGSYTNIGNGLTYEHTTPLSDGSHTFFVQAVDGADNPITAGGFGFIVDVTPPTTPGYIVWTTSAANNFPGFSWTAAADATSGIASYEVKEVKIDTTEWIDIGNVTTYTHSTALSKGSHTFSVRAKDRAGNTGSEGRSVEFTISVPEAPNPILPVDGAKSNDTTPGFDWSDVSDPSDISYLLQIDDSPDFSSVVLSKAELAPSGYELAFEEAFSQGTYYWRVKTVDGEGNESNWSTARSFSVDTAPPFTPALASPAEGLKTNSATPTFDWYDIPDLSGVSYRLQVDDNSDFSSPVIDQPRLSSSGYTAEIALTEGTYYWRVKAADRAGNEGDWSSSWSFIIDATALNPLSNLRKTTPDNNATPSFIWEAVTGATSYQVKIDTDPYADIDNGLTHEHTTSLSDGSHTFFVQAVDGEGNPITAGGFGFIVDGTPPTTPGDIVWTTSAANNFPGFSWTAAADATSGIASYEVKIDTTEWIDIGNVTTYTHSTALSKGSHTFSVRAKDRAGNTGSEGSSVEFTISVPEAPNSLSPAQGAKTNDTTPGFDWSDVSDPSDINYLLQIDDSPDFSSVVLSKAGLASSEYAEEALLPGSYYWRVKTVDGESKESNWSTARFFSVDTAPPFAPALASPAEGLRTNDATPTFDWYDIPDLSGVSYRLQVDDNSDFSSLVIDQADLLQSIYTPGTALDQGDYYWRVKAADRAGNESDWSSVWSFTSELKTIIEPSEIDKVNTGLQSNFGSFGLFDFDSVSPVVATQVVRYAAIAVIVASVGILLYIVWAFRQMPRPFRYGVSAIVALLHDVLLVMGVFSLLGKFAHVEVDAMFITAVLTVVGYSVNDTVVVFDRIRENITKGVAQDFETTVNLSLVQTLARSLNTTLTTLLVVSALFFLGGETLRNFMLALLIGIATGAYSSIFVASPLLVVWDKGEWGRFFSWIPRRRKVEGTG